MKYWLGGRGSTNDDVYSFYWQSSKRPITYDRWHDEHPPQQRNTASSCIMVLEETDWIWDVQKCSEKALYMCQIKE
jgi:hypothetical protein